MKLDWKRRNAIHRLFVQNRNERIKRDCERRFAESLERKRAHEEYLKTPEGREWKRQQVLVNMIAEKVAEKVRADRRRDKYNRETDDIYGGPSYIGGF